MGARSSQSRGPGLNETDGHLLEYFRNTFTGGGGAVIATPPTGLIATGGVISDYVTTPGDVYRAHIFTSSGTFAVTALGSYGDNVEYLAVAGGGGGGVGSDFSSYQSGGGGGGAGGLLVSPSFPGVPTSQNQGTAMTVSAGPTSYTIAVGAGGGGGFGNPTLGPSKGGGKGVDSVISGPDITTITAKGGGGGAGNPIVAQGGSGYGSGGGGEGAYAPAPLRAAGAGGSYPGPTQQGFPGAVGSTTSNGGGVRTGGGGGGAGAAGISGSDAEPGSTEGDGGLGLQVLIAGNAPAAAIGTPGPSGTGWVAQGGHAGAYNNGSNGIGAQPAGGGGGNGGAHATTAGNGLSGTGGGGGGANSPGPANGIAGQGGSGIVVVRYQIGTIAAVAKATGGAISFYGGKTIHTFTNSGTFATTSDWSAATVEYVVIGGGGSGAYDIGGGGGAGAWREGTTPIGAHPVSTTIQVGAGGQDSMEPSPGRYDGSPSYFGTPITAPGGGGGGSPDNASGNPGGSGGGPRGNQSHSGGTGTGDPFPGTPGTSPTNGWGHDGGTSTGSGEGGGGGGGAGGVGAPGASNPGHGYGGIGIQLPTTYRDPKSGVGFPGPGGSTYWLAGGGGGAAHPENDVVPGGGLGGPYAGAGDGQGTPGNAGTRGQVNSGSGGGGGAPGGTPRDGGGGGSGIVLIAYPS